MKRERTMPAVALLIGCLLARSPAQAAPIPITSVPYPISQPGTYVLTQNLTYAGSEDAIVIGATDI